MGLSDGRGVGVIVGDDVARVGAMVGASVVGIDVGDSVDGPMVGEVVMIVGELVRLVGASVMTDSDGDMVKDNLIPRCGMVSLLLLLLDGESVVILVMAEDGASVVALVMAEDGTSVLDTSVMDMVGCNEGHAEGLIVGNPEVGLAVILIPLPPS